MRAVAGSFTWPFRGARRSSWAPGLVAVLLLPLLFIPLLGYAVAATRAAERDPAAGPPAWRLTTGLFADGCWVLLAILLTTLPFAVVFEPLAGALFNAHVLSSTDPAFSHLYARAVAFLILALPWGLLALLVMPTATARYAATGRARDLFDVGAAVRRIRVDFGAWNLALAAIVTGWAIGIACAGLLCVGLVPGIFYAILVSAHATATLDGADPDLAPG